MSSKPPTTAKRVTVPAAFSEFDTPMDLRPLGGARVSTANSSVGVSNGGTEDSNGKKANGSVNLRSSTAAKSVPAKAMRKNGSITGSNPLLTRPGQGKHPGAQAAQGSKPGGGSKPPHKSTKQKTQTDSISNVNGKPLPILADVMDQQEQEGNSSIFHQQSELFNATLPVPNNLEALQTVNGSGPVVNGECLIIDANGVISGSGDAATQRKASITDTSAEGPLSLPISVKNTVDIHVFDNPPSSSRLPFVSPHLQFCNKNCSKLHFCIQNIPAPGELIPFQSTPSSPPRISSYLNGYGANPADVDKSSLLAADVDKSSLLVPGIHEALDHLHGLRNFAVCYGLLTTLGRYQGFAEIEALILEKVQQMQMQQPRAANN